MSAFNDLRLFRVYEPHELGPDGYPIVWHTDVKHLVREESAHRCERCGHPYTPGAALYEPGAGDMPVGDVVATTGELLPREIQGEDVVPFTNKPVATNWSPCDERCTHDIKHCRWRNRVGDWTTLPMNIDDDAEQQAAWRILTVHHLNGRKHDLRWWNLIAACQRCHLWLQGTVVMARVYPWEHDEYFKPHAAGWYAYAYRGENLTKIQTMQRLDALLGLERAA